MALATLQTLNDVKRRALSFPGISAIAQRQLKTFFETMSQIKKNPNLVLIPFDELSSTEVVISDAAATLYAAYLQKDTATLTFSKITDHATTSSDTASDFLFPSAKVGDELHTYVNGFALANGATMQGNTTADGGTGSASNGAKGFLILGAA